MRKEFDIILPHPRTLSKWYTNTEASPGFTKESLDTLKCKNTDHTIYCALVLDEMAIRQNIEWDGSNYHGYVNFDIDLDSDQLDIANECLVFMLVAINERWKLPVGYFLSKHLNSTQKSNLLSQCLDLVYKIGVVVVSVTFDGCSSNIGMTKNLGCTYDPNNFKTNFTINNIQPIVILLDPSHIIKLVRNHFGVKRTFVDNNNEIIDYEFIEKLLTLQVKENCHLSNKLKKQHVFFSRQKMKVKLTTQLLSRSVATALNFCKNILNLEDFQNSGATIKFLNLFNDAFDILNSRSLNGFGYEKALCSKNY